MYVHTGYIHVEYLCTIVNYNCVLMFLYCRDSESSTAPINYHRNDSIDTQDSFGSQLSTPHTIDSFMSENVLPFRMSTAGPLDPIRESPSIDEPSRFTSPEDGGVKWTVGPASATTVNSNVFEYEEESKSPMVNTYIECE